MIKHFNSKNITSSSHWLPRALSFPSQVYTQWPHWTLEISHSRCIQKTKMGKTTNQGIFQTQESVIRYLPAHHWTQPKILLKFSLLKVIRKKRKKKVKSLSSVQLFATPWTVAYQALSMGFSRQENWSGLPFPSPGDLLNPGIEPGSPALQADALTCH